MNIGVSMYRKVNNFSTKILETFGETKIKHCRVSKAQTLSSLNTPTCLLIDVYIISLYGTTLHALVWPTGVCSYLSFIGEY